MSLVNCRKLEFMNAPWPQVLDLSDHKDRFVSYKFKSFASLRPGLHPGPWNQTLEDGQFSWYDLMVQLPWSDFLTTQFIKPLGLLVGVNIMWTKSNDHAPKSGCAEFLLTYVQKGQFWKNNSSSIVLLSPLVFIFSSHPPPKKTHEKLIIIAFLCHVALFFYLPRHLFCLSHRKTRSTMSVDNVGLKRLSFGGHKLHDHSDTFP